MNPTLTTLPSVSLLCEELASPIVDFADKPWLIPSLIEAVQARLYDYPVSIVAMNVHNWYLDLRQEVDSNA